jgi:N-acetylmuramoyl-L-alanine amidase-like protein
MPESLPVERSQAHDVPSLDYGRLDRSRGRRFLLSLAAVLVALSLTGSLAAATATVITRTFPRPQIVWKPIPFGSKRRAEMAAYAKRHYGVDTWRLQGPHVIVEHYTASNSFTAAWNSFAANTPDPELHELPGDCAHFIIYRDGTIYQLVRLNTMCRHTVGLNYTAIGIEHVGTSDQQILHDRKQLTSSLRLTLWLAQRFRIKLANIIGHNESLSSPYHRERYAPWRCQTHQDWKRADMMIYRDDLRRLAAKYGIRLGPQPRLRPTGC